MRMLPFVTAPLLKTVQMAFARMISALAPAPSPVPSPALAPTLTTAFALTFAVVLAFPLALTLTIALALAFLRSPIFLWFLVFLRLRSGLGIGLFVPIVVTAATIFAPFSV